MPRVTYKAGREGVERELTVEIHEQDAPPWGADATLRLVGGEHPRPDGPAKVTGAARYTYDVARPRLAYAGSLLCPYAHARLKEIDEAAARAVPGVLEVRVNRGEYRHAGQAVAVVCAENERALRDGLRALKAIYEVLPAAVTVEDALKPGAPEVEPGKGNRVLDDRRGRQGDPAAFAKAFDASEVKVEATFRTQIQTHSALEPHGSLSDPGSGSQPVVYASTQATAAFQGLGRQLGLDGPARVIADHVGGGFGAKFGPLSGDQAAAELAAKLGRPVKYMCTRREEHLVGGMRPDSIQRLKLGGTKDGQITAFGGVTDGTAGNGTGGAACANTIVYGLGAQQMEQATVRTFTARGAAFRAPGHPQGSFALEGMIDLYARKAGLDPLEVRRKNDRHPLRALQWKLGADKIGWSTLRSDPWAQGKAWPVKRGVGCAAARWQAFGGGDWKVEVVLDRAGTVTVRNAAQDIGTGTKSVLQIVVAEELGCELARVNVTIADTRFPPGPGSGGSTTAPSLAPAAREAGLHAREQLEGLLAVEWSTEPSKVRLEKGVFQGPGGKSASFAEACGLIGEQGLTAVGQRRRNWEAADGLGETAGCQFAQVAVDLETGVVKVERVVAVHDCGRVINALTAHGQVQGGVIQGISYALFEERHLDRAQGDMVNPTLDTYRITGMADCPPIDVLLTSVVSGFNNVGLMGLGEPATVPTAAAVASAVFHATGVQVRELPMTPARVLAALGGKQP